MDQRYVIEESVQRRYVGNRDAQTFLPFLLPHVRHGLDVLDAGCGVGSIALDLAPRVAPGRIVGIDADAGQIEIARASAAERGIDNAEFVTASVFELPFDDATFDIVYSEFAVGLFSAPSMTETIVGEGWASRDELDAVIAALREWGELPNAFAAWLYCGALGWTS